MQGSSIDVDVRLVRRRLGAALLCGLVVLTCLLTAAASAHAAANPVAAENALPGDNAWTAALKDPTANPPIEGYADATSVRPGATIAFHVNAPAHSRYRVEISRLGWYGGSGGRRITCLEGSTLDLGCTGDEAATTQAPTPPANPATGERPAGWTTTDTLAVPSTWVSGYYLAVFSITSGPSAGTTGFTPFIVQAPAGDHSTILVQVPSNTWQAYNTWGGQDLYTNPQAVKVSFDRPYAHRLLFSWEIPLVRFLERGGWDVSYATDDDVDANPSILLDHTLDMDAGHDEYWTSAMRDGWEAARDAGVNLAFMGANDSYWQVRYEDNRRTMVGYKYLPDPDTDPAQTTTQFRFLAPPRPECELMGVEFQGTVIPGTDLPYTADAATATDPWFAGSGLTPGAVLPGLGGYEVDSITPGCHVPPVTPLLSYHGPAVQSNFGGAPTEIDAARYTACSGAEVFSAGSLQFSWGLDSFRDPIYANAAAPASAALQAVMTNALTDLTVSHLPHPGPPQVCVPTPTFTMPSPWAVIGEPVSLTSTASDAYGQIEGENWDLGGGGSPGDATGGVVSATFRSPGIEHIALAVTDSSGAAATITKTLRICACPAPPVGPTATPWVAVAGTPAAAQPCGLLSDGSLTSVPGRLEFLTRSAASSVSVTVSRLRVTHGQIGWAVAARRTSAAALGTPSPITPAPPVLPRPLSLPAPRRSSPERIDVRITAAGRTLRESYLAFAPPRGGHPWIRTLSQTVCDGSSGQVLTSAFGGRGDHPLRVAVAGLGRLIVTLTGPAMRPLVHRVTAAAERPITITYPAKPRAVGTYRITVVTVHSALPQAVVLSAIRVATPPRPVRRTKHAAH